ncbi:hypothetical protein N9893_02135 [bacterium]|nr:hypothetical protein [bacterium]
MNFTKGDIVPFHRHSNEQSGYVISGKLRFIFGEVMMKVNVVPRSKLP